MNVFIVTGREGDVIAVFSTLKIAGEWVAEQVGATHLVITPYDVDGEAASAATKGDE